MMERKAPIRRAVTQDLAAIATVHLAAYSTSHFTSRLSSNALMRYYELFLAGGSEALVFEASADERRGEIVGFAVFGTGIAEKIAKFKKENWGAISRAAAQHPMQASSKLIRRLMARSTKSNAPPPADHLLLSIAVCRPRRGIGGHLLDAALSQSREAGADRMGLYVNVDNIGAINRYGSRGFAVRALHGSQFYMEKQLVANNED